MARLRCAVLGVVWYVRFLVTVHEEQGCLCSGGSRGLLDKGLALGWSMHVLAHAVQPADHVHGDPGRGGGGRAKSGVTVCVEALFV